MQLKLAVSSKTKKLIEDMGGVKKTKEFLKTHTSKERLAAGFSHYLSDKINKLDDSAEIFVSKPKEGTSKVAENLSEDEQKKVIDRYLAGETLQNLSMEIGVRSVTLKNFFKLRKIPLRTSQEVHALLPQNQRKYSCNDDFFKTLSPEMAYLLGFFAADGAIAQDGRLSLAVSSKDVDILEKFQKGLSLEAPIKHYTNKDGFDYSKITWTSHPMLSDLAAYGIVNKKTFTLPYPQIPEEFERDFIRGYFDGDGSINHTGQNGIRWQVCSATPAMLEGILTFFEKHGISRPKLQEAKGKKVYTIQFSTNPSKRIYELLYYPSCLSLDRKRIKFEDSIRKQQATLTNTHTSYLVHIDNN